jgi:prevent-host-death family protein
MKEITLREANQQFSKLVREVEESGKPVAVLRNGKTAVVIAPPQGHGRRTLAPRQEAALQALLKSARTNTGSSAGQPRLTRDQLHER